MLPVLRETDGPSSAPRKDAENQVEDEEIVRGWSGRRASGIVRPVSTSTLMTTALTLLLILLPAAFPDKINIASWITINAGFRVVAPELAGNERKGEREEQKVYADEEPRPVKSRKRRGGDRGRAVDEEEEERKTEVRDEKTLNVDVDGEGNIRSRVMEQYRFAIVFVALPMRICGPATRFIATHLVL
ncbi:hypothetical protein HZH68_013706 [Vespula germanica]|uniref:Uncharacterized protein n=1 Tax=Vespula germanica TaxID=30212 RepID=A0A834JGY4_VESGE|nr:hypothetical protein HZH68_013706 [Vespula germanica]